MMLLKQMLELPESSSEAERGKISTASKPSDAAFSHPAARSSQKANGPPRASGTSEIVMAECIRSTCLPADHILVK